MRELRLHGQLNDDIELSLKLDGRPLFWSKSGFSWGGPQGNTIPVQPKL